MISNPTYLNVTAHNFKKVQEGCNFGVPVRGVAFTMLQRHSLVIFGGKGQLCHFHFSVCFLAAPASEIYYYLFTPNNIEGGYFSE